MPGKLSINDTTRDPGIEPCDTRFRSNPIKKVLSLSHLECLWWSLSKRFNIFLWSQYGSNWKRKPTKICQKLSKYRHRHLWHWHLPPFCQTAWDTSSSLNWYALNFLANLFVEVGVKISLFYVSKPFLDEKGWVFVFCWFSCYLLLLMLNILDVTLSTNEMLIIVQ